jgi:hypothetical protein
MERKERKKKVIKENVEKMRKKSSPFEIDLIHDLN